MTKEEYEAKRQAKADRFRELAEKNRKESEQRYSAYRQELGTIPMGQPILVGHHSEKGHRAHLRRIDNHMRKSIEHDERVDYYERRVVAIGSNHAIFSDDPSASEKLSEKITRLEERQKQMKQANVFIRKNDRESLLEMGFSEIQIEKLFVPDFMERVGFVNYVLTNNNANIRRLKQRLATTIEHSKDVTTEKTINGVRVLDNVEDNRLQLFFPSIPSENIQRALKHFGFRWSPTNQAWQRHRSNGASFAAEQILGGLKQ